MKTRPPFVVLVIAAIRDWLDPELADPLVEALRRCRSLEVEEAEIVVHVSSDPDRDLIRAHRENLSRCCSWVTKRVLPVRVVSALPEKL